jgi:hypothetical protein
MAAELLGIDNCPRESPDQFTALRGIPATFHDTPDRSVEVRCHFWPHATHLNGRLLARSTHLQCNLDAGLI